jgi:hypothetical protein
MNDSTKNRSQKQIGIVALMACVLEACHPKTYVDAHGQPRWENAMVDEYNSFIKTETWDLVH